MLTIAGRPSFLNDRVEILHDGKRGSLTSISGSLIPTTPTLTRHDFLILLLRDGNDLTAHSNSLVLFLFLAHPLNIQ